MTEFIKPPGEPLRAFANRVLRWTPRDDTEARELHEWRSIDESPVDLNYVILNGRRTHVSELH